MNFPGYDFGRAEARIQQTTEIRDQTAALLTKLGVPLPPQLHAIEPLPTARSTSTAPRHTTAQGSFGSNLLS